MKYRIQWKHITHASQTCYEKKLFASHSAAQQHLDNLQKQNTSLRQYIGKVIPLPKWVISQNIRNDRGGLVEDICEHGIGHPNKEWLEKFGRESEEDRDSEEDHGCDGCCLEKKE